MKPFEEVSKIICDSLGTPKDAEKLEVLLNRANHAQAIGDDAGYQNALPDIKNFLKRARIIWETDSPTSVVGGVVKRS